MVDGQLPLAFVVAAGIAFITNVLGYPHWVMAGPDYSMFANGLFAVPMLSIGIQYNWRQLVFRWNSALYFAHRPAFRSEQRTRRRNVLWPRASRRLFRDASPCLKRDHCRRSG